MNNFKKKILIDLDGVLNEYGKQVRTYKKQLNYINNQKFKNSDKDKLNAFAIWFTFEKVMSLDAVSTFPNVERAIFERADKSSCVSPFNLRSSFILAASFSNNCLSIF